MALGENIKKLREANHMTQQQLADKLYVSRQTVCRWENETRCPDLVMAKKLALELDVSLDDLISEEDIESRKNKILFWHSPKQQEKERLQMYRAWLLKFMEAGGCVFLMLSVLKTRFEIAIPNWLTIACGIIFLSALIVQYILWWKIDSIR